jgi:alpha-tubulin suppressor-like RCC1 family protein
VTVVGLAGATAVAPGGFHTCARVPGGNVKCWGLNDEGQRGDGTTNSDFTISNVSGLTGARVLSAGW